MTVTPSNSLVMVVDVQERLIPHIQNYKTLVKNMQILIEGLKLFELPFVLNEQYPKGLGSTISEIKSKLENIPTMEKTTFSCCGSTTTKQSILKGKKSIAIVFGIETHVCVMQTCLDLVANNILPILVVDCCGSRKSQDQEIAIMRMIQAGVIPTTYEALLFEICKQSDNPIFKEISKLVK